MGKELVTVRNPESLELWANRIRICESSGNKVADWCKENEISIRAYYYWHNKLKKLYTEDGPEFYEISRMEPVNPEVSATVYLGTVRADVYSGADEDTLAAVFRLLGRC